MKTMLAIIVVLAISPQAFGQWLSELIEFGGHEYRLTEPLDWFAAESLAVSVGGHLVTIDDAAENAWVFSTFDPIAPSYLAFYIGLFQPPGSPEPGGGWGWISGDPLAFINWDPLEPNNNTQFGNENVANIWTSSGNTPGTWNDLAGNHWILPGIVEIVPSTGGCCLSFGCLVLTQKVCELNAGTYAGDDTVCFPVPCPAPCVLLGDINGDGFLRGDDIPGYTRAKLGQPPLPGENPACANYGTGTIAGDNVLFVNDLLN